MISSLADRPATLDKNITRLPWLAPVDEPPSPGTLVPGILIMRNLLPAGTFAQAIQNIPATGQSSAATLLASLSPAQNPSLASNANAQAVATMGAYYPCAIYCDRTIFANGYATNQRLSDAVSACVQASASVAVTP